MNGIFPQIVTYAAGSLNLPSPAMPGNLFIERIDGEVLVEQDENCLGGDFY